MLEKEKPLKWLSEQDEEWQWAAAYLKDHLSAREKESLGGNMFTRCSSYENITATIKQIQKHNPALITLLQQANRQRRHRTSINQKKPVRLALQKDAISKLKSIAKRYKTDETEVIATLIEQAWTNAKAEVDYEKKLKGSIQLEQKIAAQAVASMKNQRDEVLKFAERQLTLLARWELMFPDDKPATGNDNDVSKIVESKMKELRDALQYIEFRDTVLSERLF